MNRRPTAPMMALLKATERFRAGTMTEADRQLIATLLSGIAQDRDVREYFFESIRNRPRDVRPAQIAAALLRVIAEHKGEKIPNKVIQRETGLSKDQVDHAWNEHGREAQSWLDGFGLEICEWLLAGQLEKLRKK